MTSHRNGFRRIALAASCLAMFLQPAQANRILRSNFYENTGLGSLAHLPNSKTESAARGALAVVDLTGEQCIRLPSAGPQYFLINHYDEGLQGEVGYFSVRILYEYASEEEPAEHYVGIHLQRNGNWFDETGTQSAGRYEWASDRAGIMTDQTFMDLHNPSGEKAADRFKELQSSVGNWHMKPTAESESSWSDRYLYGPLLRAYLREDVTAISARMIRFTATASIWSSSPVVFWLDPRGAKAATILIDAPRHPGAPARLVYGVTFGGTCP